MKRFAYVCALLLLLTGCAPKEYDVELRLKYLSWDGDRIAVQESDFEGTLVADDGYYLPGSVRVEIDGEKLRSREYVYDPVSGDLAIPAKCITGEVTIRAQAEQTGPADTENGSDPSAPGDGEAASGQEYRTTLQAAEFYHLPKSVTVFVDGVQLPESGYSYDPETGELVITADITGDLEIQTEADPIVYALDTSGISGAVLTCGTGQTAVPAFGFAATLTCEDGYALPQALEILVDDAVLDPAAYVYDPETGELEIPGEAITGDLKISGTGVCLILGSWYALVDISDTVDAYLAASEPSMAEYLDFEDLLLGITLVLEEDGDFCLAADEETVEKLLDDVASQMEEGILQMLQGLLASYGLDMSVEEYLDYAGIDLKGMIQEAMDLDSLGVGLNYSGKYMMKDQVLYLAESSDDFSEKNYLTYSVSVDSLTLNGGAAEEQIILEFLPIVFSRI